MENEPGTLSICTTPIGNLSDISERVIMSLKSADIIAAEDTRHSMKLINRFDIHVPLVSYHKFNQMERAEELLAELKSGKNIALISDAGTPIISDPGDILLNRCIEEGIPVTAIPGPSAAITALTLSGLTAERFSFEGFLPQDKKKRFELLAELKSEKRTMILYEAPHRLLKTLTELEAALGNRKIAVCRELTKKHEEVLRLTLNEAVAYYEKEKAKGEFVLVIEGCKSSELEAGVKNALMELSVAEHMEFYLKGGMDKKEAMKLVAKERGVSKRDIYSDLIGGKEHD